MGGRAVRHLVAVLGGKVGCEHLTDVDAIEVQLDHRVDLVVGEVSSLDHVDVVGRQAELFEPIVAETVDDASGVAAGVGGELVEPGRIGIIEVDDHVTTSPVATVAERGVRQRRSSDRDVGGAGDRHRERQRSRARVLAARVRLRSERPPACRPRRR
jgi:hypothetical protein